MSSQTMVHIVGIKSNVESCVFLKSTNLNDHTSKLGFKISHSR